MLKKKQNKPNVHLQANCVHIIDLQATIICDTKFNFYLNQNTFFEVIKSLHFTASVTKTKIVLNLKSDTRKDIRESSRRQTNMTFWVEIL